MLKLLPAINNFSVRNDWDAQRVFHRLERIATELNRNPEEDNVTVFCRSSVWKILHVYDIMASTAFTPSAVHLIDEAFYAGSKATKTQVKKVFTIADITINEKFLPSYHVHVSFANSHHTCFYRDQST